MELEGQVAIVTGAGRGIGRAIALELALLGADVVVAELDLANAERTAEEVRALGRRALAIQTDVTNRADLDGMAERTLTELGRIDILVNNAGIHRRSDPLEVTEEHWDAITSVNVKAVFFASQAVLPTMLAAKRGTIISLASIAGKRGSPTSIPYCASKAAVISMTRSLATAYAADGIRVNCVCPGTVDTDMWRKIAQEDSAEQGITLEEYRRRAAERIPLGRLEQPEDVANLVGFLASSKSSYMTGQAINVTGGLIMH